MGHDLLYVLLLMGILWLSVLLMWVWPPHPPHQVTPIASQPIGPQGVGKTRNPFRVSRQAVLCDL